MESSSENIAVPGVETRMAYPIYSANRLKYFGGIEHGLLTDIKRNGRTYQTAPLQFGKSLPLINLTSPVDVNDEDAKYSSNALIPPISVKTVYLLDTKIRNIHRVGLENADFKYVSEENGTLYLSHSSGNGMLRISGNVNCFTGIMEVKFHPGFLGGKYAPIGFDLWLQRQYEIKD